MFEDVAKLFQEIEVIASRNTIISLLSQLYKKSTPEEAMKLTYLLQGKVAPDYYGLDVGIGERFVMKAVSISSGYDMKEVESLYKELGDLGEVANYLLKRKKQMNFFSQPLSVDEVYEKLVKIAKTEGEGSQSLKIRYLTELLNRSTPLEGKYIVRIVLKKLRIRIGDPTILDAISWALVSGKELRPYIERAYNICSDLGLVAKTALEDVKKLKEFKVEVFKPLRPALAERLPTPEKIFEKLGVCAVEYKYDGFRIQIHKKGEKVKMFSRRLEDITHMLPDIEEEIKKLNVSEVIMEGEALAYNEKKGRFYSFQETMHRRRKYGIEEASKEYPLHLYLFDIMYLEGKDLTEKPYKERRTILESLPLSGNLKLAHQKIVNSVEEIREYFEEAVGKGLEGIMAKDLNAPYTAGKREYAWVKLKKNYAEYLDTIDVVAVGYFYGTGARAKYHFGGFLAAVYNDEEDAFETIAKVSSGFTEEELLFFAEEVKKHIQPNPLPNLRWKIKPDKWLEPFFVIEVAYDEISISQQHTAAETFFNKEKGLALRFPRFVRLRNDKTIEEITTSKEVYELFLMQRR